jgi:putative DNA primase/helicase
MTYPIEASDVKREAEGRWDEILYARAPALRKALSKPGKHVPCPNPGHQDSKDGFRVYKDVHLNGASVCNTCGVFTGGIDTLMWINGTTFKETLREVAEYLRVGSKAPAARQAAATPVHRPSKADMEREDAKALEALNRVGRESVSINHRDAEPARLYMARRGIKIALPDTLRFHPALEYYDEDRKLVGRFPAILGLIQDKDGKPANIHRIFITPEGFKAPVDDPKKSMKAMKSQPYVGGAIRLTPASSVLAIAEGIETALAVLEGAKIPTWSVVNAYLLENFEPPPYVEQVLVFSDKDRPSLLHPRGHGQEAAVKLVKRLWERGIKASAIVPRYSIPDGQKSLDWLDVLDVYGEEAIPSFESVAEAIRRAA